MRLGGLSRGWAIAAALLLAALAVAGCGLGPGEEVGSVELTVSREFGAEQLLADSVEAIESDTVMRLLEGSAEIETRYGGGYVKSIEGVEETRRGGVPYDWFFFVDGIESPVGAAEYPLRGSERIWWDYRDWKATNHVPAVVGSWPAPFSDGYEGERHPVVVECEGGGVEEACAEVEAALADEGVKLARGRPDDAIRVLVGRWAALRRDSAAAQLEGGPADSGVYASFEPTTGGGYGLVGLDVDGEPAHRFDADAGLVAATRELEAPPVWLVTGATPAAVQAAAGSLDGEDLRDHYAVASEGGKVTPLPVR
ncbi:MAG TPA: DUF4430 domain-containing protein [Solirubrobacterales bacterium]|nr:DUF4430 domain-containing protein [Solirubrobacterales bacterium]